MSFRLDYAQENFPIEIDLVQSVYGIVSNAIYDKEHIGIRQSGLYGTRPFYNPKPNEIIPVLFGTLYNGSEYAEVLFSSRGDPFGAKSSEDKLGKLEVKLFGNKQDRLFGIKVNIKNETEKFLKRRENDLKVTR